MPPAPAIALPGASSRAFHRAKTSGKQYVTRMLQRRLLQPALVLWLRRSDRLLCERCSPDHLHSRPVGSQATTVIRSNAILKSQVAGGGVGPFDATLIS